MNEKERALYGFNTKTVVGHVFSWILKLLFVKTVSSRPLMCIRIKSHMSNIKNKGKKLSYHVR